jgi:type II secretory pathway component GspD/PulD (secretin)
MKTFRVLALFAAAALVALTVEVRSVVAQGYSVQATPAPAAMPDLSKVPPEMRAKIEEEMRKRGMPMPGGPPPGDAKPPEGPKPEGPKPEGGADTVKRPPQPEGKPDPAELKARPDKHGMVQFSFFGQSWKDVLQWYADVSGSSLDWQELPGDYLNLTTTRKYTLAETRDLLNRHLLARGFTMLGQGDALSVAKIDKLDPSMIPTVDADMLEDHAPHEFVKVRYDIPDSIDPAKAAEDVKILLSPNAKATALVASKRLLVIDVVANQRAVRDLYYAERARASSDTRPRIFVIRHRRADYVRDQVLIVLGIDVKKGQNPMEQQARMQADQQRMQMMMQMQQQGKDPGAMMKKDEPTVHIAVDSRRNVLLVNAEPKEMAVIERTIAEIDVPENGLPGTMGPEAGVRPDELTLEKYQTMTASPESVISALQDVGGLSPRAQLSSESASKTIFAYATAADHAVIKRMIDKLDAAGRSLYVIWLNRRSPADQVAGTVHALMVGEKKKEENRRPWYWDYYDNNQEEQPDTGFRIQADVENNRLLLWATDAEFKEVSQLLDRLGAVTSPNAGNPSKVRVLEPRSPEETAQLLERLRQAWGGSNPLNVHGAPPADESAPGQQPKSKTDELESPSDLDRTTDYSPGMTRPMGLTSPRIVWAADVVEKPTEDAAEAGEAAPPINVTVSPDGKLILTGDDPVALDELEQLIEELSPAQRKFEVFQLYNSRASSVSLNLEEYFADELAEDDDPFQRFFWGGDQQQDETATMGKRPKLRFIWDPDTNTIVAQNASPSQLEVIRKLIKIYDQPVDEDAIAKRRTEVIQLKYSRAPAIAAALKEVFRDLLSSKDKEFQGRDNQRDSGRREVYYRIGGGNDKNKSAPVKVSFEGALSIGIDEISNTLIISAEEQVWENVRDIVHALDEEARPDTVVQVHELSGAVRASELQKVLSAALSKPWPGGKPEAASANNAGGNGNNNGQGGNNNGNEGRNNRGRRNRGN